MTTSSQQVTNDYTFGHYYLSTVTIILSLLLVHGDNHEEEEEKLVVAASQTLRSNFGDLFLLRLQIKRSGWLLLT